MLLENSVEKVMCFTTHYISFALLHNTERWPLISDYL